MINRRVKHAQSHLDLAGPARVGLLLIAASVAFLVAIAATIPAGSRILLSDLRLEETQRFAVRHAKGGIVARVHVRPGEAVGAGDLLVTLDTRDIDEQIAALKMQAEAATLKLAGVKKEAQLFQNIQDASSAARRTELERRLADVERETIGLQVRIAHAEQDVIRAEIRAPVAGRILEIADLATGKQVSEGAKIVELQPSTAKLVLSGRAIDADRNDLIPGRTARVTLLSPTTHRAESFEALVLEQEQTNPGASGPERVRFELRSTFEAFNKRIGANEYLAGELRLGRVEGRADRQRPAVSSEGLSTATTKNRS